MTNSGKELENFVKNIEEILLPKGFTITHRKRMFDENGVQSAELDIEITGKLASTQITWLIECRDRPSTGAAPSEWIEQLVGRRDRLKPNKVTAVSTTGFAPDAIRFAQESGIELRTVEQLTLEEVKSWFSVEYVTLNTTIGNLIHATIDIDDPGNEHADELNAMFSNFNNDTRLFTHTKTNKKWTINEIWIGVMNQVPDLTENVSTNSTPRRKTVKVNYTNPEDSFKLVLPNKDIPIPSVTFIADVSIEQNKIPISKITKYSNIDETQAIAESVYFEIPVEDDNIEFMVQKLNETNDKFITIKRSEK